MDALPHSPEREEREREKEEVPGVLAGNSCLAPGAGQEAAGGALEVVKEVECRADMGVEPHRSEEGMEATPSELVLSSKESEDTEASLHIESEASVASSGSEFVCSLPSAQVGKRSAESPLSEMTENKRLIQRSSSSSSENLNRLFKAYAPGEVPFLPTALETSSPKAPQEVPSVGTEAGDTCEPPDPRPVVIKEEQVSHEML